MNTFILALLVATGGQSLGGTLIDNKTVLDARGAIIIGEYNKRGHCLEQRDKLNKNFYSKHKSYICIDKVDKEFKQAKRKIG